MSRKSKFFHYRGCGLKNVYLRNGFLVKDTPYGRAVSIQNLEALHRAIGLHLVRNKARLSAAEIRFLRKELDMSQTQLARFLGVGETTVRHWESSRGKITRPAEHMLRLLYHEYAAGRSPVRELVERLGQLNRDGHAKKMEFEEAHGGWRAAA